MRLVIDFFSILGGFGRVLGGQNGRKIKNFDVFGNMLFETLFSVKFNVIFEKIDDEKHKEISLFSGMSFSYLCAEFVVSLTTRNLKNSDFP